MEMKNQLARTDWTIRSGGQRGTRTGEKLFLEVYSAEQRDRVLVSTVGIARLGPADG